jgi:hypothetical protein
MTVPTKKERSRGLCVPEGTYKPPCAMNFGVSGIPNLVLVVGT